MNDKCSTSLFPTRFGRFLEPSNRHNRTSLLYLLLPPFLFKFWNLKAFHVWLVSLGFMKSPSWLILLESWTSYACLPSGMVDCLFPFPSSFPSLGNLKDFVARRTSEAFCGGWKPKVPSYSSPSFISLGTLKVAHCMGAMCQCPLGFQNPYLPHHCSHLEI